MDHTFKAFFAAPRAKRSAYEDMVAAWNAAIDAAVKSVPEDWNQETGLDPHKRAVEAIAKLKEPT